MGRDGAGMGAVGILQDRQAVGEFSLTAECGGIDLLGNVALVAQPLDGISNRMRSYPVLTHKLHARQRREDRHAARIATGKVGEHALNLRCHAAPLQESDVGKADLR